MNGAMDNRRQDIQPRDRGAHGNSIPRPGEKPRWRDAAWLLRYSMRGLWELLGARIAFIRFTARDIGRLNQSAREVSQMDLPGYDAHIARIGYVLPRLSRRLPWRSDCLIQAMAGQNWLSACGIPSEIEIGVEQPEDGEFGAHAWLVQAGKVVTGGDVSRYATILDRAQASGTRMQHKG